MQCIVPFSQQIQLDCLCCSPSARPGPLEIIAAQPAGDVHRLADRVQARHAACFHRLRGKICGADAADGDFGLGEAFGSVGRERPRGQLALGLFQQRVAAIAELAGQGDAFGQGGGEPIGQMPMEQAAQPEPGFGTLCFPQPASGLFRQEVDRNRVCVPPIGRDLEDGR